MNAVPASVFVLTAVVALDTPARLLGVHSVRYLSDSTSIYVHELRDVSDDAAPHPARRVAPAALAPDDELAWIDRAQRALLTRPAEARAIIDAYRTRVLHRAYDEEATAIAAEASARVGDRSRAVREADAFEDAFPASAYADRVRIAKGEP